MAPRFAGSGVEQQHIDVHVFDASWRRHTSIGPVLTRAIEQVLSFDVDVEHLNKLEVEKPDRFMAMEDDARLFLEREGFYDLPPVFLLAEGPELEDLNFGTTLPEFATTSELNYYAAVRQKKLEEVMRDDGLVKAASIIVHELAHTTLRRISLSFRGEQNDSNPEQRIKSGFVYADHEKLRGMFLEEGFASYMAGQYVRSKSNSYVPPTSIEGAPRPYVPDYYRVSDSGLENFPENTIMGPDGYALEMLMWGVEQKGVMDAVTFRGDLLASRFSASQTFTMRNIIGAINEVKPGLYERLSRLHHSQEAWRDGCAVVYEAVTGKLWPEHGESAL